MNTGKSKPRKNPPKRSADDTRITLQIPKKLLAKIKKDAARDGRTLASYIRIKLDRHSEGPSVIGVDEDTVE